MRSDGPSGQIRRGELGPTVNSNVTIPDAVISLFICFASRAGIVLS